MKPKEIDYYFYLDNMRSSIESKFGSIKAYCDESGVSRPNLTNALNGHHEMSLGTYIRVITDLGLCSMENVFSGNSEDIKALNRVSLMGRPESS